MVTAADIKLLPYFTDNYPVKPRLQRQGSGFQPVARRAFEKTKALGHYKQHPTRLAYKDNNFLYTYNASRQVQLQTIHPTGRCVDTFA